MKKAIKQLKKLPVFKSEDEEREFWQTHDSTEYLDWSQAVRMHFPNLKPSTETISLRLPKNMLVALKVMANKKDIPYQSYIKVILDEKIQKEHKGV